MTLTIFFSCNENVMHSPKALWKTWTPSIKFSRKYLRQSVESLYWSGRISFFYNLSQHFVFILCHNKALLLCQKMLAWKQMNWLKKFRSRCEVYQWIIKLEPLLAITSAKTASAYAHCWHAKHWPHVNERENHVCSTILKLMVAISNVDCGCWASQVMTFFNT